MRCRWLIPAPLMLVALVSGCTPPPEMLTMQEEAPKKGTAEVAYYRNGVLGSEELDTEGPAGTRDVWRYYDRGVMVREDLDMNHDGAVDTIRKFDKKGTLIKVISDLNYDGRFDKVEEFDDRGQRLPPKDTAVPNLARSQAGRNPDRLRIEKGKPNEADAQAQAEDTQARQTGSRSVSAQELFGEDTGGGNAGSDNGDTGAPAPAVQTPVPAHTAPAPAPSGVRIEEPAPAANEPGSIIRRINVPAAGGAAPASGGRGGIVPDAQLRHPSEGMEE